MSGFDRRSFLKASVATAAASALAGCAANAGSSALAPKASGRSVMGWWFRKWLKCGWG